jgi:hypothetical protein
MIYNNKLARFAPRPPAGLAAPVDDTRRVVRPFFDKWIAADCRVPAADFVCSSGRRWKWPSRQSSRSRLFALYSRLFFY